MIAMRRHTLISFLLLTVSVQALPVFIGTSTGVNSTSKGIYLADFDPATGKLSEPVLGAEYEGPGFLALHPVKPILYSIGRPATPYADGSSSVAAFAIGEGNQLTFLGDASVGGKGACHLAVDATGRSVAIANYGDGSISTLKLDENGVPGEIVSLILNEGSGPHQRQNGPHAHGVYFDKANRHLFVPDLGVDRLLVYPFNVATGKLGEPLPPLITAPGAGPRHMAFSPDEKHAYVINELDSTMLGASYEDGSFTVNGSLSTLPADFTGGTTAEVEVHANGNFVYGSNRGHNSIVVYHRNPRSGGLTHLQNAPCGGKIPRHFKIDPSGKWLLCGHQESNTISVLPLDTESGMLGDPGHTVAAPSPVCILFGRTNKGNLD